MSYYERFWMGLPPLMLKKSLSLSESSQARESKNTSTVLPATETQSSQTFFNKRWKKHQDIIFGKNFVVRKKLDVLILANFSSFILEINYHSKKMKFHF